MKKATTAWFQKFKCRETLLFVWTAPLVLWAVLLLLLPQRAKEAVETTDLIGLFLTIGGLYIPTIVVMLNWWFTRQSKRALSLTSRRFWIAFVCLLGWGIGLSWYFVQHVYLADYHTAEACDEFVEARMHAFVTAALYAYTLPRVVLEPLFSGLGTSDSPGHVS